MSSMISPYWGKSFFGFLYTLFSRFFGFCTGRISLENLASDEVQLLVLFFISSSSALIGCFLSLRKMTMLANSLSHTILLGIAIYFLLFMGGAYFTIPLSGLLFASIISALCTAIFTEGMIKVFHLPKDASIGMVFTALFAVGIILITLFTRNTHLGTEIVIGNIDALHKDDIILSFTVFILNLVTISIFYKGLYVTSFDETLAKSLGISPSFYHYLLMILLSFTTISAFRAVGIVLFLILVVGPFLTVRLYSNNMKKILFYSSLLAISCSIFGVALSRHLLSVYHAPCSTSAIVCLLVTAFYLLAVLHIHMKKWIEKRKELV